MRTHLVFAHPERHSFCGAMMDAACDELHALGHDVAVSDLYADGFDPVGGPGDFTAPTGGIPFHYQSEQRHAHRTGGFAPDIAREQDRVAAADAHVFVFPLWWGGLPAILKGWFDRVLAYGFAYEDGMRYESGYFRERTALLGLATGGTRRRFSEGEAYGSIEQVLWPIQHCMLDYMGMQTLAPFVAYAAPRVDDAQRDAYLQDWRGRVRELAATAVDGTAPPGPPAGMSRPETWVTTA